MQGMQTRKRSAMFVSLLSTVMAGVLLVSGCSKSEAPSAPLPDAATLLKQSADTTRAQQSVHLVLTVNGKIAKMTVTKLTGDMTLTPAVAGQGKANLSVGGMGVQDAPFVVYDNHLYASLSAGGPLSDFGPADAIYDISAILRPETGLANILDNFTDAKAVGREDINGVKTVKVTGTVSADAVNKIAPQLKVTSPLSSTAWVQEDGNHQLAQAQLEVSPGNSLQMTLTDWGKPVTVAKPDVQ
ncbi:LppX_LprAFG lipoprotein [Mycobacterium sp. CBMA293]|nr:LppX_LprAFG lipoprotein [Mycolicibacterium sp. CBMA 360]MUL58246.1 LppX_LprAFG lipoprotein [Mycolicibacterium sp. CBMA 335]MUL73704.1 LppX_LprAFG lipoprotein [Mycolicibacterium sp. CBMA 311]MUL93129.1 LppX_LprAFG lipoprotein [Mycolicibacterium sp. CBMA 230]MUM09972.1 LppX_LprAFG lipoprotein [Mycolicibacterium sp. CBMA 293]MUM32371.1 LppX_LprAFG lipoprotein [Mycolicibacterium sp. CBMA 361]